MPSEAAARPISIEERLAAARLPPLPRGVWLEIDESALAQNLRLVRALIGPRATLNAVVKADAYGHGLVPVARVFEAAGADRLCVASLDEALVLRGAGVQLPILILFPIPATEVTRAAQARFEIVAAESSSMTAVLETWVRTRPPDVELAVHLEVETGLARGGVKPRHVAELALRIIGTPGVRLAGIWSHLASPGDESATFAQDEAFERAVTALREAAVPVPARHLSATGGLLSDWAPIYEGVRPGLMLYGILPANVLIGPRAAGLAAEIRPAMTIKCRPLRIEPLATGRPVGYGGRWVAPRDSLVATLPIGYGDGWARAYSPGAEVLVRGNRVPIVGTVAMDAVMADVTDVPGVGLADEFVLLGEQSGARIVTDELARARNTIPWEVVTSMAYRLPRVYHAHSVLLGLRTLAGDARVDAVGPAD